MLYPKIIQGGMGVAVSDWTLARAVSTQGQLGVVSGTALAVMLARRLQSGDIGGHMRRALDQFPIREMAANVLKSYFLPDGKPENVPFKTIPMPSIQPGSAYTALTMAANFVEVFLAKEGHHGVVGINFLEKIQLPHLPSLYGAMLAGVDYVLMGAGIPRYMPGIIDLFSQGEPAKMRVDVQGAVAGEEFHTELDPRPWFGGKAPQLKRPDFLGIVASATVAITLARKSSGKINGFIIEGETAGGHNAPPRGQLQLSEKGEPVYGPRDVVDLKKIEALGLPYWLAGSFGQEGRLADALELGAAGIQVGTAFAFCSQSGMNPQIRQQALDLAIKKKIHVFTDPRASPTGFPFKIVELKGTISEAVNYKSRKRVCDLGFLRSSYRKSDGTVGYRCASEPIKNYIKRGGKLEDTLGRKCVCNGLLATAGFAQVRSGQSKEVDMVTAGLDAEKISRFMKPGSTSYTAADVIRHLLGDLS